MCVCAIGAGVPASKLYVSNNLKTTSTMRAAFKATGMFDILTASKYLTSDEYLQRGDILVNEGSHTVMVLSNGSKVVTKPVSTTNNTYKGKGIGTATALTSMNIRESASTSGKVITSISKGTKVEVLEKLSSGWLKIVWPSAKTGYAYVSNIKNKYFTYKANSYKVKVTADALNVRAGAGVLHKVKKVIYKNETLTITEEKSGWGKLSTGEGWVSLKYTKKV